MPERGALDTAGLDMLIGFQLALASVPSGRVFRRHIGEPFGLREVEFTLLVLLLANPGAAPKRIAQALSMAPPQLTAVVDRLAARGLLERRKSARDGRALELWLTDKGQTLARRTQAISRTMEDGMLAALSPAERAMLRELLVKLSAAA